MRWEALFGDLQAQLAAEEALAFESEAAERTRAELAGVTLRARLRANSGAAVTARVRNGHSHAGSISSVGADWLTLAGEGRSILLPFAALLWVEGLGPGAEASEGLVVQRLTLASAFRALARDRAPLTLELDGGGGADAAVLNGVVDRAARDHLDFAVLPPGEARRRRTVSAVCAVPYAAVVSAASLV